MNYKIVYSSLTGNTKIIAKAIKDALGEELCTYYGNIEGSVNHKADIVFVGFWVNRGTCTHDIKQYLEALEDQKIVLFGTAGFGDSESYFQAIVEKVKSYIPKSNDIIGSFMCQGKMTEKVLMRYSAMLEKEPENSEIKNMVDNYYNALSHPDENDIKEAQLFAKKIVSEFNE